MATTRKEEKMKHSKKEMDKWLRNKYGVTLNDVISGEVDYKIIVDMAWGEVEETDAGNEDSIQTSILNYCARFIHP